ncbi:MAG: DUF927 domain-containing protein [Roseicyclus sp.]|nr:DUF927 domain-containing protein [Roseicyclus sp.]MBO6924173.1 DUF927 domain-containing protein [Roseicyclus sp.]
MAKDFSANNEVIDEQDTGDETPMEDMGEPPMLLDAELYGESTPEMERLLDTPATFMAGLLYDQGDRRNTRDGDWKETTFTWYEWMALEKIGLCNHPVAKGKQGPSYVFAEALGGARKDSAIKTMYAVGLDIDSGATLEEVMEKLIKLEIFAIVYTSFSHGKSVLELKHDDIVRKLKLNDTPNRAQVQAYLREHHKDRYDADFIDSIIIKDARHQTKDGLRVVVETPALDKFRVILPLAEPVELADLGATMAQYKEAWENAVCGVAVNTLGVNFDASSCDVNRLFYTPRHPADAEDWYCAVVQGDPLSFDEIKPYSKNAYVKKRDDSDPFSAGTEGTNERENYMTPKGVSLNRWHKEHKERFLITDVIEQFCDDKIRKAGNERAGTVHVECCFEHEHSTTGGTATMCMNPTENSEGYWTIFCRHDACQGRDKLEFLQEILQQGWFEEDLLTDDQFNLGAEDSEIEDDPVSDDELDAAVADAGLSKESTEAQTLKFMRGYSDADQSVKNRLTEKLGSNTRQKGVTAFSLKQIGDLWKKIANEELKRRHEEEDDRRAKAQKKAPGYVPLEEATAKTVRQNAKAADWYPKGYACGDDWIGRWVEDGDKPKFYPTVRPFEVVYFADGKSGSSRTNQLTIRYQHRSKGLGVVESTFRIGDAYTESGAFLRDLRNEGLDFHPQAPTPDIVTVFKACASDREAVYHEQSGWNEDRSVYMSPTGEAVARDDDKRVHVLEHSLRVSDDRSGDEEAFSKLANTALRGRNAMRFTPGFLGGGAGCLANFIGLENNPVIENYGKARHGKTTSLKAGAAWFAIPTEDGLVISANATWFGIEAMSVKASGAMFAPDEDATSDKTAEQHQQDVANYAGGVSRLRGKGGPDLELRDVHSWSGCMGRSTEYSILDRLEGAKAKDNGIDIKSGIMSRIFAVSFDKAPTLRRSPPPDKRGDDYDSAEYDDAELDAYDALAHEAKKSGGGIYTVAGPIFARKLLEYRPDVVRGRVSALTEEWCEGRGGAAKRVVETAAVIAVTGQIAQEAGLIDDDIDLTMMIKCLLEETLEARAHHLDTERQARDALRLGIIRAVNNGQILPVGFDREAYRSREILGYYQEHALSKQADEELEALKKEEGVTAADIKEARDQAELEARTYQLPLDRVSRFTKAERSALIADLREAGALVEPNGEPSGVWRDTHSEGRVPSIRVSGAFVHG